MLQSKMFTRAVCGCMLFALSIWMNSCQKEDIMQNEVQLHNKYAPALSEHITDFEVFTLDYDAIYQHVKTNISDAFRLDLEIPTQPEWRFTVKNDDYTEFYDDDYGLFEITADNQVIERQMHEIIALEGYEDNSTHPSWFTLSLGRLEGMIFIGEVEYYLEAVFNYDEKAPKNVYVLYKTEDAFVSSDAICREEEPKTIQSGNGGVPANKITANCYKVQTTYLGDYKFYLKWSTDRWANSTDWTWKRWYYGNKRYWSYNGFPLNWTIVSQYQYSSANTNPDNYTDKQAFVDECSAFYGYGWYNEGDANMFWTGYNVTGVWGKADGIGRLCYDPSQAFAFGEKMSTTYANSLCAHEVGHTMGMHHDNGSTNFMNSSYNSWNSTMGSNAEDDLYDHLLYGSGCTTVSTCE